MTKDDVEAAERLSAETSYALDAATRQVDEPEPTPRSPERSRYWRRRCAHLVANDAPGCWAAEDAGELIGVATSLRRESWWGLSSFWVSPTRQSAGVGKRLLDAALQHADGADLGMICASHDPKALRRYRMAGLTMHPAMVAWGTVDRSAVPAVGSVRDGTDADFDLCDAIDRRTRGAGHGVDHHIMYLDYPLIVVDDATGSGYCYLASYGGVYLLAATSTEIAVRLLWEAFARGPDGERLWLRYATAEQEWAVDVALAARLEIRTRGYLAYRGMPPAAPYLPSSHFM